MMRSIRWHPAIDRLSPERSRNYTAGNNSFHQATHRSRPATRKLTLTIFRTRDGCRLISILITFLAAFERERRLCTSAAHARQTVGNGINQYMHREMIKSFPTRSR